VAYDLEAWTTKEDAKRLHRPVGEFGCFSVTADGYNVYVITERDNLQETVNNMRDCIWVAQNATYDLRQISRWITIPPVQEHFCTMAFDRVLWGGFFNNFSIKDLARRYLELYISKETRSAFQVDSYAQIPFLDGDLLYYNAVDTAITWKILQEQLKRAKNDHLKLWREVDGPAMLAFLEFKGVFLDKDKWIEIEENNKAKLDELTDSFPFNPNAPAQVKEYCNETLKLGLSSTGAKILAKHAKKHQIIADLLLYRKLDKRRSTYGMNWIDMIEEDGRIYSSWDVNRAESGRTASSSPNLQNILVKDTPEYRECIIAAPGNVIVGGDYAQQEIRTGAYNTQDKTLIQILKDDKDIYSEVGKKIDVNSRSQCKDIVLGMDYGISAWGLSRQLDISKDEAQKIIDDYFREFPEKHQWCLKQKRKKFFVTTAYGRRIWLNPYSHKCKRNAINGPNQGSGADMIKLAMVIFHKEWKKTFADFPLIIENHDELVAEVKEEFAEFCQGIMESSMLIAGEQTIPGIPIKVEVKTGKKWSEVH
jgi:DNA polymerase-1